MTEVAYHVRTYRADKLLMRNMLDGCHLRCIEHTCLHEVFDPLPSSRTSNLVPDQHEGDQDEDGCEEEGDDLGETPIDGGGDPI